jgi:hypothetical protein
VIPPPGGPATERPESAPRRAYGPSRVVNRPKVEQATDQPLVAFYFID